PRRSSSTAPRPSARSPPRCSSSRSRRRSRRRRPDMGISLLPAFLGGALALLSPCGALLLPGYLASTVTRRAGLLLHGAVFYVGLLLTLVPLGVGAGALGGLLAQHRAVLVAATSVLLILLGAVHALGIGLDPARVLPGADRLRQASARGSGQSRTFLLGAVGDRKSTRLNSSHVSTSYAVFCLKKKRQHQRQLKDERTLKNRFDSGNYRSRKAWWARGRTEREAVSGVGRAAVRA